MSSAQQIPGTPVTNRFLCVKHALGLGLSVGDTSATGSLTAADTVSTGPRQKSPLVAVLLSAVIPGGGQIYNQSYWKVPIVWGVQAFFVTQWISNNRQYESLKNQVADSIAKGPPYGSDLESLENARNSAHDQRDSYAWYIAGVYLISVVDAYVDAELSGFDVSPALAVSPDKSGTISLSIRARF